MKIFTSINEFKQLLIKESNIKKRKLNYTDGKEFYYFTLENGLYWFVNDKNGKTVYIGKAGEEKEQIIKKMNLTRVPIKSQKTINESLSEEISKYEEDLKIHIIKIGENPDIEDLTDYIWNNYTLITGYEDEYKYEEGHWPEQIEDLVDHYNFDLDEFQQEWLYYLESSDINESTTASYKELIKRAKQLGIETVSELEDLISDEFDDENNPITGADFEIAKKQLKVNESNDTIDWELQNHTSSLKFIYPPKPDSLTKKFLDFIYQNPGSTKAEFYNHINRQLTPGNNAHFFAGIKDAGLVELVGNKYYIGQNYGKWTQGKLSTNPSKAPSFYDKMIKHNESLVKVINVTEEDLDMFKSHTGLNSVIEDGMIVYEDGLDMFALVKHSDGTFILMKYNDVIDEYEELPGLYDVRLNKIS